MFTPTSDLLTLVRWQADSLGIACDRPQITGPLEKAWSSWENAVGLTLLNWAKAHVRPDPLKWANLVFEEGEAPVNVWLTITESGAGIWDGRWDRFFKGDTSHLKGLTRTFKISLIDPWLYEIEGALSDAAHECSKVVDFRKARRRLRPA